MNNKVVASRLRLTAGTRQAVTMSCQYLRSVSGVVDEDAYGRLLVHLTHMRRPRVEERHHDVDHQNWPG